MSTVADMDKNDEEIRQEPIRVLLVEDNPLDAELFREFLADTSKQMDYELEHVDRLALALQRLGKGDIDVVFLDFLLPDSDGFKSLGNLKAHAPHVPVILLTGLDDDAAGLRAIQEGAQDYLVKGQIDERTIWRILRYAIERKRIQEKIEEQGRLDVRVQQAQRAESLSVLAGGIAHDYNNLLTGILGNAALALAELPSGSPTRPLVQEIQVAAERAGHLTQQMLAYSGKHAFDVRRVNLDEMIREMTPLLDAAVSKHAVIRYRLSGDSGAVEADPGQLQQVLVSLVSNASEAIEDDQGLVTISTRQVEVTDPAQFEAPYMRRKLTPGKYASIMVKDTGCGMNRQVLEKIFDPFFTTKFIGRGLGLASVLGIVRGHRGAVHVTSEVGKGTVFEILLPLAEAPVSPPAQKSPVQTAAPWSPEGTILVIDSEDLILSITRKILTNAGFKVITAHDGEKGLTIFRDHVSDISAAVVDAAMPRMNGEETIRAIKAVKSSVRTVLCSGYSETEAVHRFRDVPVDAFLQKPFLPKTLIACLGDLLRAKSAE